MQIINNVLLFIDGFLGGSWYFPYLLLGTGLFFTIYLGFPQIRYFKHARNVLTGKYATDGCKGDTSHFQALATALSGTVGTGNISGVAFALYLGGPAALFWMWVTAFLGMTTKLVEVTLSHKYRQKMSDGTMGGGPMYFMDKRLNMKWLAIVFAIATIVSSFGVGNMPQINTIAVGMSNSFSIPPMLTGAILAIILALVIIGGITRIAKFTSMIVPLMSALYILGALAVIFYQIENLVPSFLAVFSDAFNGSSAIGGFLGASFIYAFNRGVSRGIFSNEAGLGSSAIAHASARSNQPVAQGMVSILEPFVDTIIICTLTGMVILCSGAWQQKFDNNFQRSDMAFVAQQYVEDDPDHRKQIFKFLNQQPSNVKLYSGHLNGKEGVAQGKQFTLINARSFAQEITYQLDEQPFSGVLTIKRGRLVTPSIVVHGKSLVHSTKLAIIAFQQGYLGNYGQYIVTIALLLFAFSTAISWAYYGDRAFIYLFGIKYITWYRVIYVAGFFWASFVDTKIVWTLAAISVVIMTLPNLFAMLMLAKEMKQELRRYWQNFNPND